ncbi:MAG: T9SS type A sorting domain-containing protein [Crocinitomicaceae bacterium]|nr:T9SS type A sorting domain-containing protein [Crocinitomicaceae bacterium]
MRFGFLKEIVVLFILFTTLPVFSFNSKLLHSEIHQYDTYFHSAYLHHPEIPKGILEAIAFSYTRIQHHQSIENTQKSCLGIPETHGVMGLTENGKGFFKNNLTYVSVLSGFSKEDLKEKPKSSILGYAKAYSKLLEKATHSGWNRHVGVLKALSEIPQNTIQQDFALNSQLYVMFWFLNQPAFQEEFQFPNHMLDLADIFGEENYKVLSSNLISINREEIKNNSGNRYTKMPGPCADFPGSIWIAADATNFSSRGGTTISAITIHDIEGTYAGAIAWFQNPIANVSAHYCLRSIDGQVTQMVCESDKAWHVGTENPYTIGLEHEGKADYEGWYTEAMYQASSTVCLNTMNNYGIDPLRAHQGPPEYNINVLGSCIKLKGHQHFNNTTHRDPGLNWDWSYFYRLLNDGSTPITTSVTSATGNIYDSGGAGNNYNDDERLFWLIEPPGATSISINFSQFDIELDWDYLYLYDGKTVHDDEIGVYTGTTSPGTIMAESGSLLLEFRSDCATTNPGWSANYSASYTPLSCPVPTALIENSISPMSAELNWNGTSANYLLRYRDHTYTPWTYETITALSYSLTGLSSNSEYYWGVASICGSDTSSFAGKMFTTPAATGTFVIPECNGIFRDSGGPIGVYLDAEDYTCTLTASGTISIDFISFNVENNYDFLYVYDGPSIASPQIPGSPFSGIVSPGAFTATGNDLTFRFNSDSRTTANGWEAIWTCSLPGPTEPTASFSVSSSTICADDSLQLVNNSLDATSFEWTMPEATPVTSSAINPWITYDSSGIYQIQLIANGPGGSDTTIQNIHFIIVPEPEADFIENSDSLFLPVATLTLSNTSAHASSYYWDFGDGYSSSDSNPWHTYTVADQYAVVLTAYSASCGNDTDSVIVHVFNPLGLVKNPIEFDYQLSPNPTSGEMTLTVNSPISEIILYRIFDSKGAISYQKEVKLKVGNNQIRLNFKEFNLAKGQYLFSFSCSSGHESKRIIYR